MTRRLNDISTYKVNGKKGTYMVSLEKIENDCNGNPRYRAIITRVDSEYYSSAVYTFTGHYCGDAGECEHIVSIYEQGL